MKPNKLVISAIGPYAGKMPEINFEQFEDKGIFLISGDTGAGKTTIFDAICFALYGTTSGTYRDTKNLRSEYAGPGTESYVNFYFSHQGRNYNVYRQPSYERPNQRGNGIVTEKEKAVLYVEGDSPIEGVAKVNKAVVELLHVDDKQFKQIAMIAQGEFWSLLNAKTEQRTEILRTIFMTDGYKGIEDKLKKRMDEEKNSLDKSEHSVVQYFNDVSCDDEDEIFDELNAMKEKAVQTGRAWKPAEMIAILDRIIEADEKKLEEVKEELAKTERELDETKKSLNTAQLNNALLDKLDGLEKQYAKIQDSKQSMTELEKKLVRQKVAVHEIKPIYSVLVKLQDEIKGTGKQIYEKKEIRKKGEDNLNSAAEKYKKAQEMVKESDGLKKLIDKISDETDKYSKRDKLKEERDTLCKEREKIRAGKENLNQQEEKLKGKICSLKNKTTELRDKPSEKIKAEAEGTRLKRLYDDIDEILVKSVPERNSRLEKYESEKQEYLNLHNEYERQVTELIHYEKILEYSRAGILAQNLEEGNECPVCGSVHHPKLAKLPDETITEEELKEKKTEKEEVQRKKTEANTAAEVAKKSLEEFEKQMIKNILDCISDGTLDMPTDGRSLDELTECLEREAVKLKKTIEENANRVRVLDEKCKELKLTEEELSKAENEETAELKRNIEKLNDEQNRNELRYGKTVTELEQLKNLEYSDFDTALTEKKTAERKLAEINEEIETAAEAKLTAEKDLTAVNAEIKTLEMRMTEQQEDCENQKKELDRKLAEKKFESVEDMLGFVVSEEEISENERKINEYRQKESATKLQLLQTRKEAEEKKYIDVNELENLCSEQIVKNKKIRNTENRIANRVSNNTEKRENISLQRTKLEKTYKQYDMCRRLYALVKGTTGNGKITLEQYIQASGFDGIIAAANRRLKPMSDNRYELYRREDSPGKKTNTFLDLEVLDNYTGCRRPVGNLSGGESFKASLSLALGLSDTVSSNLGGIQMDALFIDEGFGTLDRKSIESAMEILVNLSGTNKLVGVISHREELKENIPQKIYVRKTNEGSLINVESEF